MTSAINQVQYGLGSNFTTVKNNLSYTSGASLGAALIFGGYDTDEFYQYVENSIEGNQAFGNGINNDIIGNKYVTSSGLYDESLYQATGSHTGNFYDINYSLNTFCVQDEFTTAKQFNNSLVQNDGTGYRRMYSTLNFGNNYASFNLYQDATTDDYVDSVAVVGQWNNASYNVFNINRTSDWANVGKTYVSTYAYQDLLSNATSWMNATDLASLSALSSSPTEFVAKFNELVTKYGKTFPVAQDNKQVQDA